MRPPRPVRCKLRMDGPDPTLALDRPKPEPPDEDDDPAYREPITILDLHHHPDELPLVAHHARLNGHAQAEQNAQRARAQHDPKDPPRHRLAKRVVDQPTQRVNDIAEVHANVFQ